MNNKAPTYGLIGLALVLVIGGIAYGARSQGTDEAMQQKDDAAMMAEKDAMMKKEEAMMAEKDSMAAKDPAMAEKDAMMMKKGSFVPYEASLISRASKENKTVLFFNASWCPSCQATTASLKSAGVPDGVTVLSVDYDTNQALRQKYGVTYQHTFVQVDASGNQLAKWSGSPSGADIASKAI